MDPKFGCKQCGKTYKWKPEFAGKKVKCKCGYVMTAPAKVETAAAAADEPDLDALYDLADAGQAAAAAAPAMVRCPACTGEMEPGTQVCPSCGFNLKTGKRAKAAAVASGAGGGSGRRASAGGGGASVAAIPSGGGGAAVATAPGSSVAAFQAFGKPRRGLQKDDAPNSAIVEWYIPIGLIAAGLVLSLLQAMKFNTMVFALPDALMFAGAKLVISLVLLAVGCYLCVMWGEVSFGSPGPAALKIAGLALAPSALAFIVSFLIHDLWGFVGFFMAFGIYFTLCNYLFEWDMSEKWIVTGLLCVVCMVATPWLANFALGGGAVPGIAVASKAVKNEDASIDYMVELGRPKDARKWIDESSNRLVGDMPRGDGVSLIDDLYALKPKDGTIWIVPEGPQAAEILFKAPSDAKKRKAFFDWRAGPGKKYGGGGTMADHGEKWFVLGYFPVAHPEPIGF
jgi:hypothetical protein